MAAEWWALGVAIFALIVSIFKEFMLPWLFSPAITLCGRNKSFYIEDAEKSPKETGLELERYLRLKIRNSENFRSSRAKNCYVKLLSIKKNCKLMEPFTPVPLKWSSYDQEGTPYADRKHDLAKGEYHYIDLCHESDKEKLLLFQISIPSKLGDQLSPGKYQFKVKIYGDNFKPVQKKFNVEYNEEFGQLKYVR